MSRSEMTQVSMYTSLYMHPRNDGQYKKLFGSRNRGLQEAANAYLPLRMYTLRELKGQLSKNELTALTDLMKEAGLVFSRRISDPATMINKDTLVNAVMDSEAWFNLEVKYGVDYQDMIFKLGRLTSAQAFFLQSEIAWYWKLNKGKRHRLDEFIEKLL